jgi:hypothetical protein
VGQRVVERGRQAERGDSFGQHGIGERLAIGDHPIESKINPAIGMPCLHY